MFDILGLKAKSPFQDGEQPETLVDDKVEKAKKVRAEKEARIKAKATEKAGFQPRKVSVE